MKRIKIGSPGTPLSMQSITPTKGSNGADLDVELINKARLDSLREHAAALGVTSAKLPDGKKEKVAKKLDEDLEEVEEAKEDGEEKEEEKDNGDDDDDDDDEEEEEEEKQDDNESIP